MIPYRYFNTFNPHLTHCFTVLSVTLNIFKPQLRRLSHRFWNIYSPRTKIKIALHLIGYSFKVETLNQDIFIVLFYSYGSRSSCRIILPLSCKISQTFQVLKCKIESLSNVNNCTLFDLTKAMKMTELIVSTI